MFVARPCFSLSARALPPDHARERLFPPLSSTAAACSHPAQRPLQHEPLKTPHPLSQRHQTMRFQLGIARPSTDVTTTLPPPLISPRRTSIWNKINLASVATPVHHRIHVASVPASLRAIQLPPNSKGHALSSPTFPSRCSTFTTPGTARGRIPATPPYPGPRRWSPPPKGYRLGPRISRVSHLPPSLHGSRSSGRTIALSPIFSHKKFLREAHARSARYHGNNHCARRSSPSTTLLTLSTTLPAAVTNPRVLSTASGTTPTSMLHQANGCLFD